MKGLSCRCPYPNHKAKAQFRNHVSSGSAFVLVQLQRAASKVATNLTRLILPTLSLWGDKHLNSSSKILSQDAAVIYCLTSIADLPTNYAVPGHGCRDLGCQLRCKSFRGNSDTRMPRLLFALFTLSWRLNQKGWFLPKLQTGE